MRVTILYKKDFKMLDISTGVIKHLFHPQNVYDGMILGLNYMPTMPIATATAAIFSGVALYIMQPETLLTQISVVAISSGLGWGATEAAHQIGSKLCKKRLAEIDADYQEYEKTAEIMKSKLKIEELVNKILDDVFKNIK